MPDQGRPAHAKAVACLGLVGGDFMGLKGMLEKVFAEFDAQVEYKAEGGAQYHPTRKAGLYLDGKRIGQMGQMHPDVMKGQDVEQPVLVAEFDCSRSLLVRICISPISRFQVSCHAARFGAGSG